jgi:hypothetical protein
MMNPWMRSITVSGGPKNLLTLMELVDPTWANNTRAVTFLQLQLALTSGNIILYVGNAQVTATDCGFELIAGQAGPNSMTVWGNPIALASIWLLTSSIQTEVQVNVVAVQA